MKLVLLCLFILFSLTGNAQHEINLWFEDGCTGRIVKLPYSVSQNSTEIFHDDTVKCVVPAPGIYTITATLTTKSYSNYYSFNMKIEGARTDTLYLYKIALSPDKLHSQDTIFKFCSRVCNGREKDYDLRNHKRADGVFVNGWPRRRLKYYNEKGELIRVETYKKKHLVKIWDR